jgi:hypothetical protein
MKTEKTITKTLTITRYPDETLVLDEDHDEYKIVGYDWTEAGYSWKKDFAPIIALVAADGIEREVTMTRVKIVETYNGKETTEHMINRIGCGQDEIDMNI